jgi:hypothetical protein
LIGASAPIDIARFRWVLDMEARLFPTTTDKWQAVLVVPAPRSSKTEKMFYKNTFEK